MIRITITLTAYAAIAGTLPWGTVGVEPQRAENGGYFIWVTPAVVNKLTALRALDESYSQCPSPDDLRHIAGFQKGGSGSSLIEIMRQAVGAASDGLLLSGA
jgi:hypothetical protein